jgi:uncharacterized protein YheU (UPF0270 family)
VSDPDSSIEIPWRSLSADALRGVLEEFATREGTEYGVADVSLEVKVAQLQRQLERGDILVFFDTAQSTCHLVPRDQLRRVGRDNRS